MAKRRLSNFDFSKEGCHVSIVTASVGGAANGKTALLLKGLEQKEEKDTMEMIEKALHEELVQKAVQEALEPIQKALKDAEEKLAAYEQEKIEAVEKSRKDALAAAMGVDNPELESTFAAVKSLEDAAFNIVIKQMKVASDALKESIMFKEVGVDGEKEVAAEPEKTLNVKKYFKKGK